MITVLTKKEFVVKQDTPMGVVETKFRTVKGAEENFVFTASDISVFEVTTVTNHNTEERTFTKFVKSVEISPRLSDLEWSNEEQKMVVKV